MKRSVQLISLLLYLFVAYDSVFSLKVHKKLIRGDIIDSGSFLKAKYTSFIINGVTSRQRLFYAKIKYIGIDGFCGATILSEKFVITAAHCVFSVHPNDLYLKVGDFAQKYSSTKKYAITAIYIAPGFNSTYRPVNDLAILKTTIPIVGARSISLPLCTSEIPEIDYPDVLVGTCGLGSVTTEGHYIDPASELREMLFTLTVFDKSGGMNFVACRDDNLCTVPLFEGANICFLDDGGPFYRLNCETLEPECLLGVASHFMAKQETRAQLNCNDGSFFVKIAIFVDWIETVLRNNY